jgi:hypothetical protein
LIILDDLDWYGLRVALAVLFLGTIALMLKLMIFALAIDDWWELHDMPKFHPELIVASDEAFASALRVLSVVIIVLDGLVWLLRVLIDLDIRLWWTWNAVSLILLALIAVIQGARALSVRRLMARILNRSRRPVGKADRPDTAARLPEC